MEGPLKGFSHIQLRVADVPTSVAWYTAALGLTPLADEPMGGAVPLSGANGRFVVVISGDRPETAGGQVDHVAFAVSDRAALTAWGEHLTAAGIGHEGLVESGEGWSIHLVDPDGLQVELIAGR